MPSSQSFTTVPFPHNLQAVVQCRALDELFGFTTEGLGTLPGVEGMEVGPILRQVEQAGTRLDGDCLTDPPDGLARHWRLSQARVPERRVGPVRRVTARLFEWRTFRFGSGATGRLTGRHPTGPPFGSRTRQRARRLAKTR
ncbi:hypothetical protein [Kitasatospora sp. NBC_01302]|uniref:hypothetical protein n=1 Tax=Kitasatospora sp. NBC_01302 TaxID=2903575 RepID=UPI002E149561|nr:hypothetical protein OG294_39460 [Kitasatospora sp. NBC_01302]